MRGYRACAIALLPLALSCATQPKTLPLPETAETAHAGPVQALPPPLPPPDESHRTQHLSVVVGWPPGKTPLVPEGFKIKALASNLDNPRQVYVAPNGDILIAESNTTGKKSKNNKKIKNPSKKAGAGTNANRITLVRDANGDGIPEIREIFLSGLNQPFGMLVMKGYFYVAATDGLWRYPYRAGDKKITGKGEKIVELPAGGYNNHWTRNILASADGRKIYITVGSASNVAEHGIEEERRRANILEVNPDGTDERVLASGLRNPVGLSLEPTTAKLWTAVNERDNLGDELVPDYMTEVREGAFYGWPYSYYGQNEDPRRKGENPELVKKAIPPDFPLGSHTASLGLVFSSGTAFPEPYRSGAFVGQHGSWNRTQFSGYRVTFVPFANGRPSGAAQDFVSGFIKDEAKSEVYGRPVGVAISAQGNLLVADDSGDTVWIVSPGK